MGDVVIYCLHISGAKAIIRNTDDGVYEVFCYLSDGFMINTDYVKSIPKAKHVAKESIISYMKKHLNYVEPLNRKQWKWDYKRELKTKQIHSIDNIDYL